MPETHSAEETVEWTDIGYEAATWLVNEVVMKFELVSLRDRHSGQLVRGTVKWDGCCHYEMPRTHFDGVDELQNLTRALHRVLAVAAKRLERYEGGVSLGDAGLPEDSFTELERMRSELGWIEGEIDGVACWVRMEPGEYAGTTDMRQRVMRPDGSIEREALYPNVSPQSVRFEPDPSQKD